MPDFRYVYLGTTTGRRFAEMGWDVDDRGGQYCDPVRLPDGKCILSTKFATQLVRFADGTVSTVARRRLRLKDKYERKQRKDA